MIDNLAPSASLVSNTEVELQQTHCSDEPITDFVWEQDTLHYVGCSRSNMTIGLSFLDSTLKESFKQEFISFASRGEFAANTYFNSVAAIAFSLTYHSTSSFNITWVAQSLKLTSFEIYLGAIRRFFIHWKESNPNAISDEAIQLLVKSKSRTKRSSNVLSDNPELSWLTDIEYEALLAEIWRNYENGKHSTDRTLMLLLSMQYARRPVQLARLKIGDFRIAAPGDSSGLNGYVVNFPGVKDKSAAKGFRDSKFEIHPLPDHLWNLFELQREQIRTLFESNLNIHLSDVELEMLPVFTIASRLRSAVTNLEDHYQVDWQEHLSHRLFHLMGKQVAKILSWISSSYKSVSPPLSHRTGRPMKVNATRLRHTRARQLARKGVPLHVLSYWLGHTSEKSLSAYYNDPAEVARKLDEAMAPALIPLAMAFTGNLIDSEDQASRRDDPTSRLEFDKVGDLKTVGHCGKHSFCATTSVPIPCYRCRHFEPLVTAPHLEVLEALKLRQIEENKALHVGGARNLLVPIDLSSDIRAVQNCIDRCNARKAEQGVA